MKQIDCVIIPARGGSKRIPRKNIQPFCGIPMLERSIELAKKLSDNVIVSSDDYSMLEFAKNLGAYPLLRDKALADDMTPTLPVIIHALLPFIKVESFDKSLLDSNAIYHAQCNEISSLDSKKSMDKNSADIATKSYPNASRLGAISNLHESTKETTHLNKLESSLDSKDYYIKVCAEKSSIESKKDFPLNTQNEKNLDSKDCYIERNEISNMESKRDFSATTQNDKIQNLDSNNHTPNLTRDIKNSSHTNKLNDCKPLSTKNLPHTNDTAQSQIPFESNENSMHYKNTPTLQILPHSKVLCLYATAMFATEEIILESCSMLDSNPNTAYIVAMLEASKTFRSFSLDESGHLNFLFPEFIGTRSQDLPKAFIDAGQFYLGKAESFLKEIPLLGDKSMGITMQYAHDIDTMLDLAIAESLFTCINKGRTW